MNNPRIPFRIAAESSVGFLAAQADFAGDGCTVTMAFDTIMNSTIEALHRMRVATDAADKAWCQEMLAAESEASGVPIYEPSDYKCWPVDLEGEELEEALEPDKPDPATLADLYGSDGEAGRTGTRKPFPDWEHISDWIPTDWLKLQI